MASEFEVKYRSSPAAMELLEAAYGPFETVTMETAYYDAPGRPLATRYWTLRRRLENGCSICALKTPGEGLLRGEWETECDSIEAAIPALLALGAPEELGTLTAGGLTQTCAARFTRRACLVSYGNSKMELALDCGALLGGAAVLGMARSNGCANPTSKEQTYVYTAQLVEKFEPLYGTTVCSAIRALDPTGVKPMKVCKDAVGEAARMTADVLETLAANREEGR